MAIGTLGLAFLAGILSVLSPCVLPLVPIVLGTAASEHKLGPLALAIGLSLSFTVIGHGRLRHRARYRCIPPGLGGAPDWRRPRPARAAPARAIRRGHRSSQPMGRWLSRQF